MLRFRFGSADDDPVKAQASWEIEHETDQHDMTVVQGRRYHELALMLNAGLDVERVLYARWLVQTGRVQR